jgi:hypothetical protein
MEKDIEIEVFAIKQLWGELPTLLTNDEYRKIESEYSSTRDELDGASDENRQAEITLKLLNAIWKFPVANNRLQEIRNDTNIYKSVLIRLAEILAFLGLREGIKEKIESIVYDNSTRTVLIKPGGIGETKSIKINNIEFDFGEIGKLAAGIVLAAQEAVEKQNPIILATSVIIIASSIYSASTKEISEQEATVFWGFIKAVDEDKQASLETIHKLTNLEREKLGLDELTKDEVKNSLLKLKNIKSVKTIDPKDSLWQITEKYDVKK